MSVGHVHLKLANLERALAFYRDVLGFTVAQRFGPQAVFPSAGRYLHHIGLDTWESEGGSPPPNGATGLHHVTLLYPARAALAEAVRRVIAAGLTIEGASDHAASEAKYLRDPDGNGLEPYCDHPARTSREALTGRSPCTRINSISPRCCKRLEARAHGLNRRHAAKPKKKGPEHTRCGPHSFLTYVKSAGSLELDREQHIATSIGKQRDRDTSPTALLLALPPELD